MIIEEVLHKMVTREDLLRPEINEVVKEVHEMRRKLAEKYGNDLDKMLVYYQEVEKEMRKSGKYKFVDPEPPAEKPTPTESSEGKAADL